MESKRLPGVTMALRGNPSWLTTAHSLKPLKGPLLLKPQLASISWGQLMVLNPRSGVLSVLAFG